MPAELIAPLILLVLVAFCVLFVWWDFLRIKDRSRVTGPSVAPITADFYNRPEIKELLRQDAEAMGQIAESRLLRMQEFSKISAGANLECEDDFPLPFPYKP